MLMAQEPSSVIDFLKLIPEYVWILLGVLIAGVLPWVGIALQLRHDSQEREKERKMSLRRGVYLSAAEKFAQEISYLMDYYQTTKPPPEGYNEAITQTHMIGSNETIVAINSLDDFLNEAFCELGPLRAELDRLGQEIQMLEKLIQHKRAETEQHLQEMKEYILQGIVDTHRWSVIQDNYKLSSTSEDELLGKMKNILEKLIKLQYEVSMKCKQKAQLADKLLNPIVVAIRKELDITFDVKAYIEMKKESDKKWDENVKKYIASMKHMYEEMLDKYKS